ncbi:L-histidine N(alpha)-methyltransferase [uncultured Methylobacterium sp.]|jgi:dimethylhistidine N-methyltransferase|uniref:L-histidine N(alpha)-methyltransferase n=1 Tax=uncultured Methylobacterium sp. TaxID=157278 RepID=UPI0026250E3A|nr:L-histidine N(alpha)-methyltransferase [uncultured Methylobacterium sp.]
MPTTPSPDTAETAAFRRDALAGLSARPRALPGKYLWDVEGSTLFDRICGTRDYYPTGREMTLLPGVAAEVARRVGAGATVVEYGSGASRKIRVLLDALPQPARYVALDISWDFLKAAVARLAADYPGVEMIPVHADYSQPLALPVPLAGTPVLGFFPGTSISNFSPRQAVGFMERARATLGAGWFLIGVDPTRDEDRLLRAYGGADGLMAALHLNLLARANRELGATFDLGAFRHEARVRPEPFRVEAHLVATRDTACRLGGEVFRFAAGESIHTDNSYKYAPEAFREIARQGGWTPEAVWQDELGVFSLHLLRSA